MPILEALASLTKDSIQKPFYPLLIKQIIAQILKKDVTKIVRNLLHIQHEEKIFLPNSFTSVLCLAILQDATAPLKSKKEKIKATTLTTLITIHREWDKVCREKYIPFYYRVNELIVIWNIVGNQFPEGSPRFKEFQTLQAELGMIREAFIKSGEARPNALKKLQSVFLNKVIARRTPLHWLILNTERKISKEELERYINRLIEEGADPDLRTVSYTRRFMQALREAFSHFPFLPTMFNKYYYPAEKTAKELALERHGITIKDNHAESEPAAAVVLPSEPAILLQKANASKAARHARLPNVQHQHTAAWRAGKGKK